jgi:HAMP domain-containing protein
MPHHEPLQVKRACRRAPRGQALVLASLSLLLLALMVALSFNLSYALRTKTRLQQHSDAMAYSMAIVEARTLNYFAVSNRAIAASYVAMNSLHSYMAAASVTSDMMMGARTSFFVVAGVEALLCAPCPFTGSGCDHCPHVVEALKVAKKFKKEAQKYEGEIKKVEKSFNRSVESLDRMMDAIHASQQAVFLETSNTLRGGTAYNLDRIKSINAPLSKTMPVAVGGLNVAEFSCAIDGMPCAAANKAKDSPRSARAKVMTEVANATRPDWPANRGSPFPYYLNPQFLADLMSNIQGDGVTVPTNRGTAKTVQSYKQVEDGPSTSNEGKVSAADEHGMLFTIWKHGVGAGGYEAVVASAKSGSRHEPKKAHSETHDKFEGVYVKDLMSCAMGGNCFMKFRSDPDPKHDYGQPRVYSYVSEKMRLGNAVKAPWELNSKAQLNFTHKEMGTAKVQLAADEGAAVSNAMVYYHRLGDWQEQPNMFNPFWRAKLHPFTPQQAALVLGAAGNTDAAQLAATPNLPL